jgi:hypothetical protein
MKEFKHLKSFESFSQNNLTNEEISFKDILSGKIGKAVSKFKEDNSDLMSELKAAEKKGGDDLMKVQKELNSKLSQYKKELISKMKSKGEIDNINDINVVNKNLSDIINNIDPKDKRSFMQKVGSGAGSGMPGKEKK